MNSGVLCFKYSNQAEVLKSQSDELITNWKKYQVLTGTPDKIIKIKLSNNLMDPGILVFNKNEIIQLEFEIIGQFNAVQISIKGYEDVGKLIFPKGESTMTIKMIADKPGAGFPILMDGNDQPIGMIKVLGAHTMDEEVM